jgi:formylmethanofuran dehydrogenase subunit D
LVNKNNQKDFNRNMDMYISGRTETRPDKKKFDLGIRWIGSKKEEEEEVKLSESLKSGEIDDTKIHIIEKDTPWYYKIFDGFMLRKKEEDIIEEIEEEGDDVPVNPNTGDAIDEGSFEEEYQHEEEALAQTPWYKRMLDKVNPFTFQQEFKEYDVEVDSQDTEDIEDENDISNILKDIKAIKKDIEMTERTQMMALVEKIDKLESELKRLSISDNIGGKSIRKLVLYKPNVDKDISEYIRITSALMKNLPHHIIRKFEKSPEYEKYQAVLARYSK